MKKGWRNYGRSETFQGPIGAVEAFPGFYLLPQLSSPGYILGLPVLCPAFIKSLFDDDDD
jgi:hypothetical protein